MKTLVKKYNTLRAYICIQKLSIQLFKSMSIVAHLNAHEEIVQYTFVCSSEFELLNAISWWY